MSQRGNVSWALAGLGMLAALGCTTTQKASAPLWDRPAAGRSDTQPDAPQERINVWPLLYARGGAVSVLWPLAAFAPDAHEVIPVYAWNKTQHRWAWGIVHPELLPALATYDAASGSWRVLLAWWNAPERRLFAWPLILTNREGFWTLPYARYRSERRRFDGILGPLVYYAWSPDRREIAFPYPIVRRRWDPQGRWSVDVWPLVSLARDPVTRSGHWALLRPRLPLIDPALVHWQWRGTTQDVRFLGWLGAYDRAAPDAIAHRLWPLWHYRRRGDQRTFLSIPWVSHRSGGEVFRMVLLDLYWDRTSARGRTWALAWPLWMRWTGADRSGHMLLPLYYVDRAADGRTTLITLPYSSIRDGERRLVGLGALYFHDRSPSGDASLTMAALGTWGRWRSGGGAGHWLAPLYYAAHDSQGRRSWQTLLGGVHRGERRELWNLALPPALIVRDPSDGDAWGTVLPPLYWYRRTGGDRFHALIPLFAYSRSAGAQWFASLPFAFGEGVHPFQKPPGGLVLRWFHNSTWRRVDALAGLAGYEVMQIRGADDRARGDSVKVWMVPLVGVWRREQYQRILSPVWWAESDRRPRADLETALSERIAAEAAAPHTGMRIPDPNDPLLERFSQSVASRGIPLLLTWRERRIQALTAPPGTPNARPISLFSGESFVVRYLDRYQTTVGGLLYRSDVTPGVRGHRSVLWRLYNGRFAVDPDGTVRSEQRLLWRVWSRVRSGDRVEIDLFPFLAFDRDAGWRKWSFAGGLLGYERRGDTRTARIFWVPIRWGRQVAERQGAMSQ